jgi:hypothetical protein
MARRKPPGWNDPDGPSLITERRDQLGLRLDAQRAVLMLVIESFEPLVAN